MWVKLDDGFGDNPKVDGLTDGAFRLYVLALCHAGRNLTDGHIDTTRPRRLVPHFKSSQVKELTDRGLWEPDAEGWTIHGFLERNPTAEKVRAEREATALRQARSRQRGTVSNGVTDAVSNGVTDAVSAAYPTRPDPKRVGGRSVVVTPSNGTAAPPQAAAAPLGCENCTSGWVYLADKVVTPCPTCRPENP